MSIGIGAHAKLVIEDERTVIYEYGGYNLNSPVYRNEEHLLDGTIAIQKECFVEPEIYEKMKKMSSGRKKLIVKLIPVDVEYEEMLEDGRIIVENCSNTWKTSEDELCVDLMACRLLYKIFLRYQEDGSIPDTISYNI